MLVTVANFTEPYEAHLLRGRLEAEGIAAFVAHDGHVGNNWPIGLALGGVKVQVHRDLAKDARAIERACITGDYYRAMEERFGQEAEVCPNCGAADFWRRATLPQIALMVFATLYLATVAPLPQVIRICRHCKTQWRRELPE